MKVHDWEDIAIDHDGNLYVSDTGDNDHSRKHAEIHRLREPDPAMAGAGDVETWERMIEAAITEAEAEATA